MYVYVIFGRSIMCVYNIYIHLYIIYSCVCVFLFYEHGHKSSKQESFGLYNGEKIRGRIVYSPSSVYNKRGMNTSNVQLHNID